MDEVKMMAYLERILKAVSSDDPLSVSIVCYQSIRECSVMESLQEEGDKEKIKEFVVGAIEEFAEILRLECEWEELRLAEFVEKTLGFAESLY